MGPKHQPENRGGGAGRCLPTSRLVWGPRDLAGKHCVRGVPNRAWEPDRLGENQPDSDGFLRHKAPLLAELNRAVRRAPDSAVAAAYTGTLSSQIEVDLDCKPESERHRTMQIKAA
jgi:hypothetical protein